MATKWVNQRVWSKKMREMRLYKCWINCMIELDFHEAYLLSIY